jgi:Ca2+-binding RTX toxin-like protein
MIIDVKGAKQSAPSDEPSRQKYLLKELKNSSAPFAIAAALASVALYLQSILPGMARAAPEAPTDPVTEPRAQQATGEATLQLVEPDPNRVQVDPDEEMDAPAKKAPVSKLLDGGGDRYELVDSPPMRLQSSHSPSVSSSTGEAGANDNSYPTPAHFESKQFGGQPAATRDGGGGEPQSRVRAEDEDVEEILNRAPRSTGHIVLPNVFGPAVITLSASDLLNGVEDPDGDVLEARNVTVNAGKLLKTDEGWTFEPAEPGPVTLRYEISDGRATIIQTAEFSAELPLPVFGGEGPDSISGTSWADTIDGLGGDDMIDGLAGDDILKGGDGDDHIVGGSGADLIFAGAGNDIVFGGAGNDTISGGDGDDILSGDEGNDTIFGDAGNDHLSGGVGDDLLLGGDGDDLVDGGEGNDTLYGDAGNDHLSGGGGRDILQGGDGDDIISGGDGDDLILGQSGSDILFGDAGADDISGGDGHDTISGGDGDDRIDGGAGEDTLQGDVGNDIISDGEGADIVDGGDGDDVVIAAADAQNDSYVGGDGFDTIDYSASDESVTIDMIANTAEGLAIGEDTIKGFEQAVGGAGDDNLYGSSGDDTIAGGDGDDTIKGADGNDILQGGAGDDTLQGGAGNDVISDGEGADIVDGGDGDDVVIAAADAQNDTYTGGDGFDTIDYSTSDESVTFNMIANTAEGLAIGEDTIEGFEHAIGGAGDDHFIVGHHATIMTGGGGENVFEFVAPPADNAPPEPLLHKIVDFKPGDLIKMNKYEIFDEIADTLEDDFEAIYGKKVDADDAPVRYRYDSNDSMTKTIIEADVNRDGLYETTVIIEGRHALVIVEDA